MNSVYMLVNIVLEIFLSSKSLRIKVHIRRTIIHLILLILSTIFVLNVLHDDFFCPSRYEERIDRVETRITSRLRDQLGTAKNAGEMFRIFSRFNALFVRPHIQGAIREYQTQLIQRVKDDIETLHNKFKVSQMILLFLHGPKADVDRTRFNNAKRFFVLRVNKTTNGQGRR